MGTNTGNGGFDIENKNITFANVPEGENGDTARKIDHGDINVDKTKKDIGNDVKVTLGRYLGSLSNVNRYPINPTIVDSSLTDENGFPAGMSDSNTNKFVSELPNVSQQPDLRGSPQTLTDPKVNLDLKKGKSSDDAPDGNDLLLKAPESTSTYIRSTLSNNRFDAASLGMKNGFIQGRITTTDDERRLPVRPNAKYNATFTHPDFGDMTANQLAKVGSSLSIRASGEIGSTDSGNDPTSFGSEAKTLLPSPNQLALSRINQSVLEANDVLEKLTKNEITESNITSIAPGGSWGSLNNINDQFSGINSIGMIALSVALTSGVFLIYEGLDFIINLINVGPKTLGKTSSDSFTLGRSTVMPRTDPNAFPPSDMLDIASMLGIRQTVNPFKKAVDSGMAAFFGVNNDGSLVSRLGGTIVNSTRSPGFNVVVARTIIRSGTLIIDRFKNIGGNPISVAQSILSVIDEIRTSKIISVMNVFAALGDQLLNDENSIESVNEPGQPVKKSRIDSESDDAFSGNVVKNRLAGGLKLAWSSNRSPAMYLLPDSAVGLTAMNGIGALNTGLGMQHDKARVFYKMLTSNDIQQRGARIPYDSTNPNDLTVKMMEKKLEAEYVPFYLHDLRTNEIISFHAFITALSDAYSPNWESSEGFGRVDPVQVYKNTTRKVSCGFYIASTSEEDFNDMWVKVNKLTSMVYPQYTKGRTLTTQDGQNTIIQPFSQLMSASPLVRLRIGDVIRSNYSRFALSRLFGADSGEMVLNGTKIKFEGLLEELKKKLQDAISTKNENYTWALSTDNLSNQTEGATRVTLPTIPIIGGINQGAGFAPTFQVDKHDIKFFEFKITSGNDKTTKNLIVKPSIMEAGEMLSRFSMNSDDVSRIRASLKKKYDNNENSSRRVIGGSYNVHSDNLLPTIRTVNEIKDQILSSNSEISDSVQQLSEFLNPDKNALVRSFQETRGQGLAGKIDNLDFDFYDNVTWETNIGQRAPRFFKVNFSFTPIHDISPGIDFQGFNRAPIYSLGWHKMDSDSVKEGK